MTKITLLLLPALMAAQTLSVAPTGPNTVEIRTSGTSPPFLMFNLATSAGLTADIKILDINRGYSSCTSTFPTLCVIAGMTDTPIAAGPLVQIKYSGSPSCRPTVRLQSAAGANADGTEAPLQVATEVVSLQWPRLEDLDANGVINTSDFVEGIRRILYGGPASTIVILSRIYQQISRPTPWEPCPLP